MDTEPVTEPIVLETTPDIVTIKPETLRISANVGYLFLSLLRPRQHTQLYCNLADHCDEALAPILKAGIKISAIGRKKLEDLPALHRLPQSKESRNLQYVTSENPSYFKPEDRYHYALAVFPFQATFDPEQENRPTSFLYEEDRLAQWQCSKYSRVSLEEDQLSSGKRLAPAHLIGIEGLMNAVVVGGYFGCILPKRWTGRAQAYLRWWSERTAIVARIALPEDWVQAERTDGTSGPVPGGWELVIWHRSFFFDKSTPNSSSMQDAISKWAELTHAQFIYKDTDLENGDADDFDDDAMVRAFQCSEWWSLSVSHFNEFVENHSNNQVYGTPHWRPHPLPKVEDTWFLDPIPKNEKQIHVLPSKREIAAIPNAVHVRVTNKIKLAAYGENGLIPAGLLLDVRNRVGLHQSEGEQDWNLDRFLRKKNFSEYKEELIDMLEQHGLMACMTTEDDQRMRRRERWLSLQLTPVERWIPIQRGARTADELSSDNRSWELIYDDVGMEATWPEIMELWRQRAKKMGLNRTGTTFAFQFKDILVLAAKQCAVNGNVMGLGKTRETLLAFLLRGGKRLLIICPAKLIGVWQDEIRDTIAPYMAKQKRGWNGEILRCSLNIIQTAADLKKKNLATFNIISYDTLKSVPKDSQFYRCPKCGVIVCKKVRSEEVPTCPGNPAMPKAERCNQQINLWKEQCRAKGLKKKYYFITRDAEGKPVRHFEIGYKAIARRKFLQENIEVVDNRPGRPTITLMEAVPNVYKKMKCQRVGTTTDPITGERKPNYEWSVRGAIHVKWTFAALLRRLFNHAAADESQYAANEDSQRTQALMYTQPIRTKYALTGTPIKGYPKKILPILNWCLARAVYPNYRLYDDEGQALYLKRYQSTVKVDRRATWDQSQEEADTDEKIIKQRRPSRNVTGETKVVPKIKNPDMFQGEIAPVMVRHLRTEPLVVQDIPRKYVESIDYKVDMDEDHHDYYELWIKAFAKWWQAKMEEEEKKRTKEGNLLAKLTYLYQAATIPMFMLDGIEKSKDEETKRWASMIGRYDQFLLKRGKKPKMTAKFLKLRELLMQSRQAGNKAIIACTRHANLALGERWANAVGVQCVRVDGTVSLKIKDGESRSPRHALVDTFRYNPQISWAWCGLEAMAEGMNVPEANEGFINDYTWDPTPIRQFIGRMIRPAQTKVIKAHYLMHKGTIEEYMAALCYLKGRSGDEGIDYMSFSDFSGAMVPDIHQYANAIVDGKQKVLAAKMWAAVDYLKRHGAEEDEGGIYAA